MYKCICCNCNNKECINVKCKEQCSTKKEAERKEFCSSGYIDMCSSFKESLENKQLKKKIIEYENQVSSV